MPITHPFEPADQIAVEPLKKAAAPLRGKMGRPESRLAYDKLMAMTPPAAGVTYEEATIGGVPGWWCRPDNPQTNAVILHLHGGGFVVGTAKAYRSFVGQIAARAGAAAFIPDYRLAPEHSFPAAIDDVEAVFRALAATNEVAIVGDSAGGALALALLNSRLPALCAVALSPVTDFTIGGESMCTRADADPYLTPEGVTASVNRYLGGHDPKDPRASALHGDLRDLPPVQLHVGDAEVLLDDSIRYGERHGDCEVHVWLGMPHVHQISIGILEAAAQSLDEVGAFLRKFMPRRAQ